MMKWFNDYNIILASESPRRKELMEQAGFNFEIKTVEVDESYPASLEVKAVAEYLAVKKGEAGSILLSGEDEIMLTADSVVIYNGCIFGKPKNDAEAQWMLQQLAGNKHIVITGVCLKSLSKTHSFSIESEVSMAAMNKEEIDYYINRYKPFDKAGSYGIQEWIGLSKVVGIEGSYSNIMGLPMQAVYEALKAF